MALDLSPVFAALAVIFVAICVRDLLKAEGKLSPARRTFLRVAFIFAAVALGLRFLRLLTG